MASGKTSRQLLSKRGLGSSSECTRCRCWDETIIHALLSFPAAQFRLGLHLVGLRCNSIASGSFADWFISCAHLLDKNNLSMVALMVA